MGNTVANVKKDMQIAKFLDNEIKKDPKLQKKVKKAAIGGAVKEIDRVLHASGLDIVVHHFTGGERVFKPDGSFCPDGVFRAVQNVNKAICEIPEKLAQEYGKLLQKILNEIEKKAKEAADLFKSYAKQLTTVLKKIWEYVKEKVEAFVKKFTKEAEEFVKLANGMSKVFTEAAKPLKELYANFKDIATDNCKSNSTGEAYAKASPKVKKIMDIMPRDVMRVIEGCYWKFMKMCDGESKECDGSICVGLAAGGGCVGRFGAEEKYCVSLKDYLSKGRKNFDEVRQSIALGASIGIEAGAEFVAGPFISVNMDNPADLGGFGFDIEVDFAHAIGTRLAFNFTVGTVGEKNKALGIYPSGFTIGLTGGAAEAISVSASYTYIPVSSPPEK
mmetsp:Transcript_29133/g.47318  ORF Transcript_29133/g.47318 Transcript_29133/m.47318 type:complete len:388 (+) Transcript_29133:98-1261(+)